MRRTVEEKFSRLGVEDAPGQEVRARKAPLPIRGQPLTGAPVDFSHGDVDAHPPIPGAFQFFEQGFVEGGVQAYTEYRGRASLRQLLASRLSPLVGRPIDPQEELILTPGTQGALFLAMGASVTRGLGVAYLEPDYFANRKMADFFEGRLHPIPMPALAAGREAAAGSDRPRAATLDLAALEEAFQEGARVFVFSNPNNPTGLLYGKEELEAIARLARRYGVTVIADELYARQVYEGRPFQHFAGLPDQPEEQVTIMGPSKTESMSGFRLGLAFGSAPLIQRMEKLQAIATLRCPGYNQAAFAAWLDEPAGWLEARIKKHQAIRDDLVPLFNEDGFETLPSEGGSYLFVGLPPLSVTLREFVALLQLQAGVIVTPGTEFGPAFTRHIRLNYSQDRENAVAAARRILELARRYGA